MNISELLIPELRHEGQLTETFLQRLPDDKLSWAPHEKSMPLGNLAAHLVEMFAWIPATMNADVLDLAGYQRPAMAGLDELMSKLHELLPVAEQALEKDNDVYFQSWTMKRGDKVLMAMPRYKVLRSMVLNQFPHHRAQLGVYFRILGLSVPATYGPSADES